MVLARFSSTLCIYVLAQHQVDEIDPPERFLNELKIAERLARIELKEREKFRQQLEI
jgi:hypothetical protein